MVDALIRRSELARADVGEALQRARELVELALVIQRSSHEAVLASRRRGQYARVEGVVDGRPTSAAVRHDATVVADPLLRQRLELVVAMGEALGDDGRSPTEPSPLRSTLAVLRACDKVRSVTLAGHEAGSVVDP